MQYLYPEGGHDHPTLEKKTCKISASEKEKQEYNNAMNTPVEKNLNTEFSKSVLVSHGASVSDAVRDLVDEFMKSAENSKPIEYSLSVDIELAKNNIEFTHKFGNRFAATVAVRCTMYRFEMEQK